MGVSIDVLCTDQARYLGSWREGTLGQRNAFLLGNAL